MAIRVMIVDDDELIRSSLKIILEMDSDIDVINTCTNGDEVYKNLLAGVEADVILMDIRMPVCDGVLATKKILQLQPHSKIIILTTFDDDDYIFEALKYGAKGYLLKNVSPDRIIEAIKVVFNGNLLIHQGVAEKISNMLKKEENVNFSEYDLTESEINIIRLIADGLSNKEIAEKLFLSEGTVKNKVSEILDKLQLRDRTQIAIFYLKGGKKETL